MKGVLVILDGLGDLPHRQLEDKTPLEVAKTPHLDFLATRGELGLLHTVKPGFIPSSDQAIVSLFGNALHVSSRGMLEAQGAGIKLTRGDLALRVNFATVDQDMHIVDRRAGRTLTTKEAEVLARDIVRKVQLPVPFVFEATVQHRAALVFRGGFSDTITDNDVSNYRQGKLHEQDHVERVKPLNDEENSHYTANMLNEFLSQAHDILQHHPINISRKKRGLLAANYLLIRDAGVDIPQLQKYPKWISMSYMPLEIGFSELSGMAVKTFDYPKLKQIDVYANLHKGLKIACKQAIKTIKKNFSTYDYAYIHIKETDLPGHDNKPFEKITMLEYLDSTLFKFLAKFAPPREMKVCVTGDHSTPCRLKAHSADPVPVLLYNGSIPRAKQFNERAAKRGTLGRIVGGDFLKVIGYS